MQPREICSRTTANEKLRPQIQQSNAMETQAQAQAQAPAIEASKYALRISHLDHHSFFRSTSIFTSLRSS
jgi:hypothetical protein